MMLRVCSINAQNVYTVLWQYYDTVLVAVLLTWYSVLQPHTRESKQQAFCHQGRHASTAL
jgi:hypothetical protein